MSYNLIVILGPTATGKTRLAALLAGRYGGEIISADSRQAYRGLDIGAGKDLADYVVDGAAIPVHLIDVVDPSEEFDVYTFRRLFFSAFRDISGRGKTPILAGGTGLYLSSILENYKFAPADFSKERLAELEAKPLEELAAKLVKLRPTQHNTTDLLDKARCIRALAVVEAADANDEPPIVSPLIIGVAPPREVIKRRISERLNKRLEEGMIDEVRGLLSNGVPYEKLIFFGLEYKFIALYLRGDIGFEAMKTKLEIAIGQFSKRQGTWFRRMEKNGVRINWLEGPDVAAAAALVDANFPRDGA